MPRAEGKRAPYYGPAFEKRLKKNPKLKPHAELITAAGFDPADDWIDGVDGVPLDPKPKRRTK